MTPYYFTFGVGDPVNAKKYVIIMAPDRESATKSMFAMFGSKWAFQYDSAKAAGVDEWGLKLLKIVLTTGEVK